MILTNTLVILDLETTGTWVEKDKIVEVAMMKCLLDGSQELFTKRVNPGNTNSSKRNSNNWNFK